MNDPPGIDFAILFLDRGHEAVEAHVDRSDIVFIGRESKVPDVIGKLGVACQSFAIGSVQQMNLPVVHPDQNLVPISGHRKSYRVLVARVGHDPLLLVRFDVPANDAMFVRSPHQELAVPGCLDDKIL
ncbi:hypothetical protein C5Y93_29565 [Blastopirellula marina]|uniref:Uncharacterized protein n=1 Tax=Blastopirellula marina TaxID=124 RepID=A0A2S8GDE1_9BACT|nr:hypothetical protein C5Y93_29565 [Blastopirellula marina]